MISDDVLEDIEIKIENSDKAEKKRNDSELRKTYKEVFDGSTLRALYKIESKGVFDNLNFCISTGKEGNVFLATNSEGVRLAVKIYRTSNSTFKNIMKYVEDNPRYRNIGPNRRSLIHTWAQKEYDNLHRFHSLNIPVPKPIYVLENILIMEFIGVESTPSPLLKDVVINEPDAWYEGIIDNYFKLYNEGKLVHADLSEYNILVPRENELVWIDVGQSVVSGHHRSREWLARDIKNISHFFKRRGGRTNWKKAVEYIFGGEYGEGFSRTL